MPAEPSQFRRALGRVSESFISKLVQNLKKK
jgi:hypothetical protein